MIVEQLRTAGAAAKRVILVVGMHRSGTSLIARSLRVLGVHLGDELHPPGFDNPTGFWEDADLLALDQALLSCLGAAYDSLSPIAPARIDQEPVASLFEDAVRLIGRKTGGSQRVFGFKDPRLSRLLWFWRPVLAQCHCDVSYVIALRHPCDVAHSLACRNGFAAEKSLLLWLVHTVGCLSGSVGCARLVVRYDQLMDRPEEELRRVAKTLGLPLDHQALRDFADGFLDGALRHHRTEAVGPGADAALTPLLHDVYATLVNHSMGGLLVGKVLADETSRWQVGIANMLPALTLADRCDSAARRPDAALAAPGQHTAASHRGPTVLPGDAPDDSPTLGGADAPALAVAAQAGVVNRGGDANRAADGGVQVHPDPRRSTPHGRKGRLCSYWHQVDEVMQLRAATVLELGTGAALVSRLLLDAGVAVTTFDMGAQLRPDSIGSTLDIPVPDQAFDVALCCQVFERLPYGQFVPALKELHRVCRTGIVMSLPDMQSVNSLMLAFARHHVELMMPRLFARRTSWAFDGQHYWNLNDHGYEPHRIITDIESVGFRLARQYRVFENPGERLVVAIRE